MRWRNLQKHKRTKIICTLGPSSSDPETIKKLLLSGMNLARLNFSHNTNYAQSEKLIKTIRDAAQELKLPVGIFIDLGGPKIRTRSVKNGAIELKAGNTILITSEDIVGDTNMISCNLDCLITDVKIGDPILLDDGLLELKVISKVGNDKVRAEIIYGGILKDRKGMNLPKTQLSIPALTDKDKQDVAFGVTQDIDAFALSFARTAKDVLQLRRLIKDYDKVIITKVEKPEAIENIEGIVKHSDAVMVARGDMGVELGNEKVPVYQKMIIKLCNQVGRPVITATQMLESMISNPRPTRAEASDVANSIFDGTSAVMLSGETAVGKYPEIVVKTMASIIREAEAEDIGYLPQFLKTSKNIGEAVISAGIKAAYQVEAKAIVCLTHTGATASLVARHRPHIPIVAVTDQLKILNRLSLVWGVDGLFMDNIDDSDLLFERTVNLVKQTYDLQHGDRIVICCGLPASKKVKVNTFKILEIK